jgi:hypothetical protein
VEIATLRAPQCAGGIETRNNRTYQVVRWNIPPTPANLRRAAELEAVANRIKAEDSAYEQAAEHGFWDTEVILMFAAKPVHTRKEHLARYGLFFDPSDFRLHELRSEVWGAGADQ